MEEKLISFETAKFAEEKGFRIKCNSAYVYRNEFHKLPTYRGTLIHKQILHCDIYAPTQALLLKWLRDIRGIEVSIKSWKEMDRLVWLWSIQKIGVPSQYRHDKSFQTYEETLEQGLFEALKLIKV